MPRHRRHSIEFKRQVVAEYQAGESARVLGRRHDLSRNLIRPGGHAREDYLFFGRRWSNYHGPEDPRFL